MAEPAAQNGEEVQRTGGQVQVHFVTEEKDFELDESKRVLLVPTGMSPCRPPNSQIQKC